MRYADFAYPEANVAIEIDSWEWHSDRQAFDAERARRNELEELGWHVLQITTTQMKGQPMAVAPTVGTSLGLVPGSWKSV